MLKTVNRFQIFQDKVNDVVLLLIVTVGYKNNKVINTIFKKKMMCY